MTDCFISYATADRRFADLIHSELSRHGISVFMAAASLKPGQQWTKEIHAHLRASSWVVFLASRTACTSAYVNQELGMALGSSKKVVPIVWDMEPSNLPGWVNQSQALDLRGATIEQLRIRVAQIAANIKEDKATGWLILGGSVLALFMLAGGGKAK